MPMTRWLAGLVLMALSACGPIYDTVPVFQPPADPQGRACVQNCSMALQQCRAGCEQSHATCEARSVRDAALAFAAYVEARQQSGDPVERSLSDFQGPDRCDRERRSCFNTCEADHRLCYTNCGGQVFMQRECVMFCDR